MISSTNHQKAQVFTDIMHVNEVPFLYFASEGIRLRSLSHMASFYKTALKEVVENFIKVCKTVALMSNTSTLMRNLNAFKINLKEQKST